MSFMIFYFETKYNVFVVLFMKLFYNILTSEWKMDDINAPKKKEVPQRSRAEIVSQTFMKEGDQ